MTYIQFFMVKAMHWFSSFGLGLDTINIRFLSSIFNEKTLLLNRVRQKLYLLQSEICMTIGELRAQCIQDFNGIYTQAKINSEFPTKLKLNFDSYRLRYVKVLDPNKSKNLAAIVAHNQVVDVLNLRNIRINVPLPADGQSPVAKLQQKGVAIVHRPAAAANSTPVVGPPAPVVENPQALANHLAPVNIASESFGCCGWVMQLIQIAATCVHDGVVSGTTTAYNLVPSLPWNENASP